MLALVVLSICGILSLFIGFVNKKLLLPFALTASLLGLGALAIEWQGTLPFFSAFNNNMLSMNTAANLFSAVILLSAFFIFPFVKRFAQFHESQAAEYYGIILFSLVGALMMCSYEHLLMLFLGIETLSISAYVLAGCDKRNLLSNEAALKYFLTGSFSTGVFLFGVAMLYGATGSFSLSGIQASIAAGAAETHLLAVGVLLLAVALLFKVSAAPFHFWTPDVYEGAPTVFTAYMSTIVKTASFAAFYKLFAGTFGSIAAEWQPLLMGVSLLTLFVGNVTAVFQNSFKRMLAYSSISHAGYLLLALCALGTHSQYSILFYTLAYSLASIAAFGVLISTLGNHRVETYDDFNGLMERNPFLAVVLAVAMLSLAGIPLTAGFMGKLFVFMNVLEQHTIIILVFAVLMSAVGIYYYFRVLFAAFFKKANPSQSSALSLDASVQWSLAILTLLTLALGIAPGLFSRLFF